MTVSLFVPGDRPERFAKAVASGADLVIIDLEDSVRFENKSRARVNAVEAVRAGTPAFVRVHSPSSEDGRRDLSALANVRPAGIMIAKASGASDVATVAAALPSSAIIVLIESVSALSRLDEIAAAPHVSALALGAYDLCAELGARPIPEVLSGLRLRLVVAARLASCKAIDTPYLDLHDEAGLTLEAERAVDFGFDGKLAIHPKQVATIRAAFRPRPQEVEYALGVIDAATAGGVAVYEGSMIDPPILRAAQRLLERASPNG